MNLPHQSPSSEEPEQQPILHSSEETLIQPSTTSDSPSEEIEQQSTLSDAEEDIPTLPASSFEPVAQETEQHPVSSFNTNETEDSPLDEDSAPDEEDDFASTQTVPSSQSSRSGVFIRKGVLIAAACVVIAAALLATFLVVASRPADPPTDWIASYTPPAGGTGPNKILYYLHWKNQNGELQGQLQFSAKANGKLQSITAPATGLYNRDNHIIYVVVTVSGQVDTLTGKINATNDTLTLNVPGATSQSSPFVFHTGNADDYKQATKRLV